MNVDEIRCARVGDQVVLKGYHVIEVVGDELEAEVVAVNVWGGADMEVYGLVVEANDDSYLMAFANVDGGKLVYVRVYKEWDSRCAGCFEEQVLGYGDSGNIVFVDFDMVFPEEDDPLSYGESR